MPTKEELAFMKGLRRVDMDVHRLFWTYESIINNPMSNDEKDKEELKPFFDIVCEVITDFGSGKTLDKSRFHGFPYW
jgi:hypothetical protein